LSETTVAGIIPANLFAVQSVIARQSGPWARGSITEPGHRQGKPSLPVPRGAGRSSRHRNWHVLEKNTAFISGLSCWFSPGDRFGRALVRAYYHDNPRRKGENTSPHPNRLLAMVSRARYGRFNRRLWPCRAAKWPAILGETARTATMDGAPRISERGRNGRPLRPCARNFVDRWPVSEKARRRSKPGPPSNRLRVRPR